MARRMSLGAWTMAVTVMGLLCAAQPGNALVYCNITEIDAKQLRNGVQIVVNADGILNRAWHGDFGQQMPADRFEVTFDNARNQTGRTFIDVSMYPVSHIELSIPRNATEGVGVSMAVVMYEPSPVRMSRSTDRQSFIITVSSSRTLEEGEKSAPVVAQSQARELSVQAADGRVSVTAVKVGIQELLGAIAQETGANLAVDDAVRAEVSLHLRDLSPDELLRAIAGAYGLAMSKIDGVYMFSSGVPQDLSAYRLSATASFPLRYTRAQAASGLLPTFLYSYLHVNEEQNAVVVTAPQQMLDKIKADLQAVDVAPPQILMEAVAVEFTDMEDLYKLLRMLRGDVTGRTTAGEEEEFGYPEYSGETDSRAGLIRYTNIGGLPYDFEARLHALETEQRARIRAAPRMAVINGHEANIFIGVRRFIKVEYISYGQSTEKIQGVDVGVKLRVRPLTGGGGEVTLTISPDGTEVSNVSEVDPQSGLPVLSTRQIGTTVRVKDGETVMIGGLKQQQREDRVDKIPLLGDLPLVGGLFRSRSSSMTSSELVVFITPHILTPEGRLADENEERAVRERFGVPDSTEENPAVQ